MVGIGTLSGIGFVVLSQRAARLRITADGMASSHVTAVKLFASARITYLKQHEVLWKELMQEDLFGHWRMGVQQQNPTSPTALTQHLHAVLMDSDNDTNSILYATGR